MGGRPSREDVLRLTKFLRWKKDNKIAVLLVPNVISSLNFVFRREELIKKKKRKKKRNEMKSRKKKEKNKEKQK